MAPSVLGLLETLRQDVVNFPIVKDKNIIFSSQVMTVTGAITIKNGIVVLDSGSVIAATLVAPTSGTDDGAEITVVAAQAAAHTVTVPSGHGTINGASNIATFASNIGNSFTWVAYQGKWLQIAQINITLSGS